jgi:hypothetical protein
MRRNVNALLLLVVELSKIKKCLKRCCDFKKKKKVGRERSRDVLNHHGFPVDYLQKRLLNEGTNDGPR